MKKTLIVAAVAGMISPAFGQAVNVNGNLSFNPTTNGIVGTGTNDNASAGNVGEFMSVTIPKTSSVSLTSGVTSNVMSLTLTPGDWDVWGLTDTNPATSTTQSLTIVGLGTTSASFPNPGPNGASTDIFSVPAGLGVGLVPPMARISASSSTTVYMTISATFSGGTNAAYGFIAARRMR